MRAGYHRFIVIAAIVGGTLLPCRAAERGAYAVFRAWLAGCDNGRQCRAYGFADADGDIGPSLRIDREAAADAIAALSFDLGHGDKDLPPERSRVVVRADEDVVGQTEIGRGFNLASEDIGYTVTDGVLAKAVLASIRKAKVLTLSITAPGKSEPERFTISLDGASAALLWMDDRQKRVGTVTALARPGDAPASKVPAPPELPKAPPMPRPSASPPIPPVPQSVLDAWAKTDCPADEPNGPAPQVWRLQKNLLLIGAKCGHGAYNFYSAYFLVPEKGPGEVRRLIFDNPTDEPGRKKSDPIETLGLSDYDPENLELNHFSKGRGIGDCGTSARYRWDGAAFRPIEYVTMPLCRGVSYEGWLTLWRTRP